MARNRVHTRTAPPARRAERPLFYGGHDPITLNRVEALVNNLRTMQGAWLRDRGRGPEDDRRRNLDDECGYPSQEWASEDYKDLINREPLACLCNELYPVESWSVLPNIYETEDAERGTEFETAWDELPQGMGAERSHYGMEQGNPLYATMLTADILAGEGRHGGILLGVQDGKMLSEPAVYRKGQRLAWVRAFPEYLCRVTSFDMDEKSRRFGMPLSYDVTFSDPRDTATTGINENYTTTTVHWSRVVHIVDRWHKASTSANFADPRLRVVRDPILDVRKIRGSGAEGYYKACFVGLHFGTHPSLGADVDVQIEQLRDMYEEYVNGLQRGVFTNGMQVDQLMPGVVDPNPHILASLQAISMLLRIPMRILMGSERGELASGDDKIKWAARNNSRRHGHNTPNIVVPFVNRLINLGILPVPKEGFRVWWPEQETMTQKEKAEVLLTRTQAYAQYVANDIQAIVPPLDYMTKFDTMDEETATSIIEASEEIQAEQEAEVQKQADELGLVPDLTAEGFREPPPEPVPETGGSE